jgi:hypothetical protein
MSSKSATIALLYLSREHPSDGFCIHWFAYIDVFLMQDCQPKVSQCPSCRDRHIDCRSIIAEKLLEATLKAI